MVTNIIKMKEKSTDMRKASLHARITVIQELYPKATPKIEEKQLHSNNHPDRHSPHPSLSQ